MRAILTPDQMRTLDHRTINEVGLPGIVLMELAARGVMLEIEALLGGRLTGSRALVFCGRGNNGGDGFAVARRLLNAQTEVIAYLVGKREEVKGDAKTNLDIFENLDGHVVELTDRHDLEKIPMADVVVDALFGTGLRGAVDGLDADVINTINMLHAPVVAVDIPSGVNGASGFAEGPAVRADITATFGEIKVGHIITPGLDLAGRISRVDIQIPPKFVQEIDAPLYLVEPSDIYEMLPERHMATHKGDAGKVLVIAGSIGMTGAAQLASRATLRSGAGLVKVATAKDAQELVAGGSAEIMTIPVADTEEGTIAPDAETTLREARKWADVEIVGPGLSLNPETVEWFNAHSAELTCPTVIDADGLNALAQLPERLNNLNENVILTPHLGEFARLTGLSTEEIAKRRVELVREYARKWNVTLLLKGVPTLIAGPEGPVYAAITGNPGMATAGMGDVLTGVIAGMLAQGLLPINAAIAATSIHGLAGNLAAENMGSTGLIAGDVVEQLPLAQDIIAGRAQYPAPQSQSSCSGCGSGGGCGGHDDGCDC